MKITTRASYTVRALIDLARHSREGTPVRLSDISAREGISHAYLEQLFHRLRGMGVVQGVKGPGGGYLLGRDPGALRLGDIIRSVEGDENLFHCAEELGKGGDCRRYPGCATHHLWERLSANIHAYLNSITLADLLREDLHPEPQDKTGRERLHA